MNDAHPHRFVGATQYFNLRVDDCSFTSWTPWRTSVVRHRRRAIVAVVRALADPKASVVHADWRQHGPRRPCRR